jgi:hypothetical protein
VQPDERVRWAVETAKAVLHGRMAADEGAQAVRLQASQTATLLRRDRDSVTRREAQAVATTLRLLAEQVADSARDRDDSADRLELASALGELAQCLR